MVVAVVIAFIFRGLFVSVSKIRILSRIQPCLLRGPFILLCKIGIRGLVRALLLLPLFAGYLFYRVVLPVRITAGFRIQVLPFGLDLGGVAIVPKLNASVIVAFSIVPRIHIVRLPTFDTALVL